MPKRFGSSPRTRGTDLDAGPERLVPQFIPASAGNRRRRLHPPRQQAVHPRGRGEQFPSLYPQHSTRGSSPQARGTVDQQMTGLGDARFIPAGAGNSRQRQRYRWRSAVHPRGRGEQVPPDAALKTSVGSSPRARGTAGRSGQGRHRQRFIPAGAGNRQQLRQQAQRTPVHPRGRGEQAHISRLFAVIIGSSPRARGTVWQRLVSLRVFRFIPAGAGNRETGKQQLQRPE